MFLISHFKYRPEIDGLRAIAVLAVVMFHAGFGCPGGYVGVDVFFVISGFLITSLIWKDLENGKFTFADFWERRARRIVPALVVMTLVTLIVGWFLLLPSDYASLGKASASQAIFAANIHYWLDSGYFTGAAEEKPLLHTWSLAVEEQFYLIVPFLLWGGFHFRGWLRSRGAILSLLIVGCVLSLAMSIYGVMHHPSAAFYLLPTRAWELLLGAIVAFLPYSNRFHNRRLACESVSFLGLVLILASVFLYTSETPFPGLAAVAPVFGACLLIWSNMRKDGDTKTVVGRVLSLRPVVFIGLISYSLYLWHWPLLAYSKYWTYGPLSWTYRLGMVVLAFILAVCSWRFIETPFRKKIIGGTRKSAFTFAGISLGVVFMISGLIIVSGGIRERWSDVVLKYESAAKSEGDNEVCEYNGLVKFGAGRAQFVAIGAKSEVFAPEVLLWGDSHAACLSPAINQLLQAKGRQGVISTSPATAPLIGWYAHHRRYRVGKSAIKKNDKIYDFIKHYKIKHVILSARWPEYIDYDPNSIEGGSEGLNFRMAMLRTIHLLVEAGAQPWVLLDVPNHHFHVPKALALCSAYDRSIFSYCSTPKSYRGLEIIDANLMSKIKMGGGIILDPKPYFLDGTGKYYEIEKHGKPLYFDEHHLTKDAAEIIMLPFLRDSLDIE
ncbi:acyltransferase [Akkermansiaceae bacterium]|nr:acyltransferase [Akkermansiaceae bacterium]